MTPRFERLLGTLCQAFALLLAAAGAVLFLAAVAAPPAPITVALEETSPSVGSQDASERSRLEAFKKLSAAQLTQTIVPKARDAHKPPPPPALETLIRVKGILDFGKPDENEALVEVIKSQETSSYRVGQTVTGVQAQIQKIDAAVTFQYAGQRIELQVHDGSSADASGLATPESRLRTAGIEEEIQAP
ncbi:MAG: hypothetical protein HS116_00265 [Planctomycetes bacterium]|nr:hypothetical protein [Planctomycetota bacterium]